MNKHRIVTNLAGILCGALLLSGASLQAASAKGKPHQSNDLLHFSVADNMEYLGADTLTETNARVLLRHNEQGKVTVQSLDILVQNAAADTSFVVLATLLDGTVVQVGELTTNEDGDAKLRLRKVAHSNGRVNKIGRGLTALPDELGDLYAVRRLSLAVEVTPPTDPATYTEVFVADLTQPDKFEYIVKRDVSTEDIRASLQLLATAKKAVLRLTARGLEADTPYWLAVNTYAAPEFTVMEDASDRNGRLDLRTDIDPALRVLDLHQVQLWISEEAPVAPEEPVLTTVLPKAPAPVVP